MGRDMVEIEVPATADKVSEELRHWGHVCRTVQLPNSMTFLCQYECEVEQSQQVHYLYCQDPSTWPLQCHFHTADDTMTEHSHMKLLHRLGYYRAVVLEDIQLMDHFRYVHFVDNQPLLEQRVAKDKVPTQWPERQPQIPRGPLRKTTLTELASAAHVLSFDFNLSDFPQFLNGGPHELCTIVEGLELPEATVRALDQCHKLTCWDRLIIYTDGSSQSSMRRKPVMWVDELGVSDTWSFIVIAEQYGPRESAFQFLGWMAHPVRYDPDATHYCGAQRVGSEVAEREAMIHAGLWRLRYNSDIPTLFRSDSATTGTQAVGGCGASDASLSFGLLRGVFQALQSALPGDLGKVEHIASHTGEPWNEFADTVAKQEAKKSFCLARAPIDLRTWSSRIPYLWMIFDSRAGLPPLCSEGFRVDPPQLPPKHVPQAPAPEPKWKEIKFTLSMATANANSFYAGPDGHGGKIQFLRQQMRQYKLNLIGFQETRTDQGASGADQIVRLRSGAHNGQGGLELWIDTTVPYAYLNDQPLYFTADQATVLHSDE